MHRLQFSYSLDVIGVEPKSSQHRDRDHCYTIGISRTALARNAATPIRFPVLSVFDSPSDLLRRVSTITAHPHKPNSSPYLSRRIRLRLLCDMIHAPSRR
jgi:hypothetical protein